MGILKGRMSLSEGGAAWTGIPDGFLFVGTTNLMNSPVEASLMPLKGLGDGVRPSKSFSFIHSE
jgi:hypothetical protein